MASERLHGMSSVLSDRRQTARRYSIRPTVHQYRERLRAKWRVAEIDENEWNQRLEGEAHFPEDI